MLIGLSLVLGLLFGSFISNSLWQVRQVEEAKRTRQKTAKQPQRSVCGHCGHKLSALDLIPVISWLSLRGRCRYCGQKLSIQYPLTEILTAGVFIWSSSVWNLDQPLSYYLLALWLLVVVGLLIMALYDLRWLELPDKVMAVTLLLVLAYIFTEAWTLANWQLLISRAAAAFLAGGSFYGIYALGRGKWMGGGDVKLAFVMGALLGGQKILVALFVGFLSAALLSVTLMLSGKLTRKDVIPFGPFLIAGTIIAMLYGQTLIDAYLNLLTIR